MNHPGRIRRLQDALSTDALYVSNLSNVRYLCGFTGSNGSLLMGHDDAWFLTDGRYRTQSADEVVGAVSREDLDKAIGHGLSHAPVKGIMSSRVATCAEDTPLAELQALLSGSEGRIAVLRGDKIVGVVTRSDVLRALGAEDEAASQPGQSEGVIPRTVLAPRNLLFAFRGSDL